MPFGLTDVFWIGLLPCAVAAAILSVGARQSWLPLIVWAASVGGGALAGIIGLNLRAGWHLALARLARPHVAHDWLPWLVLVAIGIATLAACAPGTWRRWLLLLACVFAISVPIRLLAGSAYVTLRWSLGVKLAVVLLWAAAIAALWATIALGRAHGQPRLRSGLLVVVALGMAATMTLSGSISYGERCGVVAAAILGAVVGDVCFGRRGNQPHDAVVDGLAGAAGPLAVVLGGLILLAYYYAALSVAGAILLGLALAAAGGRLWFPAALDDGWRTGTIRAILTLVPLTIALALALAAAMSDPYR